MNETLRVHVFELYDIFSAHELSFEACWAGPRAFAPPSFEHTAVFLAHPPFKQLFLFFLISETAANVTFSSGSQ